MISKTNCRQRAISDYIFSKKVNVQTVACLREGKLLINVARIGQMYPYVKLALGNQEFISETSESAGLCPKWNQFFSFSVGSDCKMSLIVADKSLIFGETEIGRTQIDLQQIINNSQTSWWKIYTLSGQVAGEICLDFEFTHNNSVHTPNSSLDFKSQIDISPLSKPKGHYKNSTMVSARTPDMKITHCSTEPDELYDLETLRIDLNKESERLRNQENSFRLIFQKQKEESLALIKEKLEVEKQKERLQKREEVMLEKKKEMEAEKKALQQEWIEVERIKTHLNSEFSKLKVEQLRVKTKKSLQKKMKIQINNNSNRICRQFDSLKKLTNN